MLPGAYQWHESGGSLVLRLRYGTEAVVDRHEGKVRVRIFWRGKTIEGTAASLRQGQRFVERWIAARMRGRYPNEPRRDPGPHSWG